MNRDLIDRIIDRVRQDLYNEIMANEEEGGGPTNVIGDGEGAVKLRPTLMKFDGRTKGVKSFMKRLSKDREKRTERKLLKKYPHLK
jgi:hypothetical protein